VLAVVEPLARWRGYKEKEGEDAEEYDADARDDILSTFSGCVGDGILLEWSTGGSH
jgi:hypothetical protein